MKIEYHSIGIVHSPFKTWKELPHQPYFAKGVRGTVVIYPEFQDSLKDLAGFSHIMLLCQLPLTEDFGFQIPFSGDSRQRSMFAPGHPNLIGLSIVRLESLEGNILSVLDIDVMNKTPILDIKPYVTNSINVLVHESVKLNRSEKKYQKILHI